MASLLDVCASDATPLPPPLYFTYKREWARGTLLPLFALTCNPFSSLGLEQKENCPLPTPSPPPAAVTLDVSPLLSFKPL